MADCEQAHIGEFIYNTYVQEKPMHIESVGPAKERIVRCRDCESATDHYEGMDIYWCEYLSRYVGADMFCAWGRRADA